MPAATVVEVLAVLKGWRAELLHAGAADGGGKRQWPGWRHVLGLLGGGDDDAAAAVAIDAGLRAAGCFTELLPDGERPAAWCLRLDDSCAVKH
jgi:hypothetical protein